MKLISVKIPQSNLSTNIEDKYKKLYLKDLSQTAIQIFSSIQSDRSKKYVDDRKRLSKLETYINNTYNINVNINYLITIIFQNISFDVDCKYVILKDDIRFGPVTLVNILKLLLYGNLDVERSRLVKYSIENACNVVFIKYCFSDWRILV